MKRLRRQRRKRKQRGGALIRRKPVQHVRRQRGGGWWSDFKRNTRQGYKETRDVIKQDKALQRLLTGRPW